MRKLKGLKTHRHETNPLEKKIHDQFIKDFSSGVSMEQISQPCDERGRPFDYLTDKEKEIMITTIQWLGSPVGQGFLRDCGFKIEGISK